MKKVKIATLASLLLVLISCGGGEAERPAANQVDAFMEFLILKLDLTKKCYSNFMINVPVEHNMVTRGMVVTMHELMLKQMKDERKSIETSTTFEADEIAKKQSEALKAAAIDIIDAYIEGGEQELAEVKTLVSQGETINSPKVIELLDKFDQRMAAKYEVFNKKQEEMAKEFGISLY